MTVRDKIASIALQALIKQQSGAELEIAALQAGLSVCGWLDRAIAATCSTKLTLIEGGRR
jgi:hypothetical protein